MAKIKKSYLIAPKLVNPNIMLTILKREELLFDTPISAQKSTLINNVFNRISQV